MEKIVECVVIRMVALKWTIQKYFLPSILIQDTKKPFQWLTFWIDHLNEKTKLLKQTHILKGHLNGKTELLKQTHILKNHLNGKTELLKQTHIQMDFPFQWNGMVETNGAIDYLEGQF